MSRVFVVLCILFKISTYLSFSALKPFPNLHYSREYGRSHTNSQSTLSKTKKIAYNVLFSRKACFRLLDRLMNRLIAFKRHPINLLLFSLFQFFICFYRSLLHLHRLHLNNLHLLHYHRHSCFLLHFSS